MKTGNVMKNTVVCLLAIVLIGHHSINAQKLEDSQPPDLVSRATAFIEQLNNRDFSNAGKNFDETMKTAMPEPKLAQTWDALVAQAGTWKRQVSTRTEVRGAYKVVIVTTEFEKADVDIQVVFDAAQKIAGLFFTPAKKVREYSPPDYVKSDSFVENEVTVGKGEWELPGTLTIPKGKGPFAAVVLVHGSGPNDRDETVGSHKPFRDIAWGLASKGIAVLRYEKRTKHHAAKLASLKGRFTVNEETVEDALEAVTLLRESKSIDPKKIYVLGHSLGGMLIPRIAALDSDIAGLIILAGAVIPLEDKILDQTAYLLSLDGTLSKEDKEQIEKTKTEVAKIKGFKPSDADSGLNSLGAPASYWLDLRGYDPPETAKDLKQRMLVLQGERDYQVTMEDFQRWKSALYAKPGVTLKSYPNLNHLFGEGEGMSVPAEYELPGHVAEYVINDIANWILSP